MGTDKEVGDREGDWRLKWWGEIDLIRNWWGIRLGLVGQGAGEVGTENG